MFVSRREAGKLLGERLRYLAKEKPIVLGITRGGVVVAAEVARILGTPLFPLVIKKISSPWNPEFALGAAGPESKEAAEQVEKFGAKDLAKKIKNKTVIIVDDGIATGWTVKTGIKYAKSKKARKIIVAVPVADREVIRRLGREVDSLVVLEIVDGLGAVGNFYEDFAEVTDEEVVDILSRR